MPADERFPRSWRPWLGAGLGLLLVTAIIAGAFYAPGVLEFVFSVGELIVALLMLGGIALAALRLRHRSSKIADALRLASERDFAWSETALREQIASLFSAYWTCLAQGNTEAIGQALTERHRDALEAQQRRGEKMVGRRAELLDLQFIGLHDYPDDRRDRFEVLIKCRTDIHRVSRIGELLEGSPMLVDLHQRWRFVRDHGRWLLSEVRGMSVDDALNDTEVVFE